MYNLYIAEKQKKLQEEKKRIERLENKLKEQRKSNIKIKTVLHKRNATKPRK